MLPTENPLEIAIREEAERKRIAEERLAKLTALQDAQKEIDARVAEILGSTARTTAPKPAHEQKEQTQEPASLSTVKRGPPKNDLALQGEREVELLTVMVEAGVPSRVVDLTARLVRHGWTTSLPTDLVDQVRMIGKRMQSLKRKEFVEASNTSTLRAEYLWSVTAKGREAMALREKRMNRNK